MLTSAALAVLLTVFVICPHQQYFSKERDLPPASYFTLLTMSHRGRSRELRSWVRHYSRCPSVLEIVIVWNSGPPPKVKLNCSLTVANFLLSLIP